MGIKSVKDVLNLFELYDDYFLVKGKFNYMLSYNEISTITKSFTRDNLFYEFSFMPIENFDKRVCFSLMININRTTYKGTYDSIVLMMDTVINEILQRKINVLVNLATYDQITNLKYPQIVKENRLMMQKKAPKGSKFFNWIDRHKDNTFVMLLEIEVFFFSLCCFVIPFIILITWRIKCAKYSIYF